MTNPAAVAPIVNVGEEESSALHTLCSAVLASPKSRIHKNHKADFFAHQPFSTARHAARLDT